MPRLFIGLYWKVWIGVVACLLLARMTIFHGADTDYFASFNAYMVPAWLAVMVLNALEGYRLMSYLRKYHNAKWQELTYIPGFGSGNVNGFRSLPFIYSKDDLNDECVKVLKANYRRFIALTLTIFFTMIPLGMIVMSKW